jgi:ketol-acid reductoisomerase
LEEIFGDEGLINADDIVCFEIKCSEIEERAKALSSKFHRYFDNKLKQNLTNQWNEGVQRGHFDKGWTNNNSESLNHVLKWAINWQSEPLLDLVNTLNEIIDTQFRDLLRALVYYTVLN